jgi:hypothetical protein
MQPKLTFPGLPTGWFTNLGYFCQEWWDLAQMAEHISGPRRHSLRVPEPGKVASIFIANPASPQPGFSWVQPRVCSPQASPPMLMCWWLQPELTFWAAWLSLLSTGTNPTPVCFPHSVSGAGECTVLPNTRHRQRDPRTKRLRYLEKEFDQVWLPFRVMAARHTAHEWKKSNLSET